MSSISTQLEQKCGGRWRYSTGVWECDDGRYVVRQHTGGVDVNGEAVPGYAFVLYDQGEPTRLYGVLGRRHARPGRGTSGRETRAMIVALLICILLVLIVGPEAFLHLLWGLIKFAFWLAIVLAIVAAVVALTL